MSAEEQDAVLPARQRRSPWSLTATVMPLIALALALWLLWHSVPEHGPVITLGLTDAAGIEPGHTPVRHRGVRVGSVTAARLLPANKGVALALRLDEGMEAFAREGAQYWVVRPELQLGRVSGLRTLVSGRYIAAAPGAGEPRAEFEALARPPLPDRSAGDLLIALDAPRVDGLARGSPIRYLGIRIGAVESLRLAAQAAGVRVQGRIYDEHRHLVRKNNVFWRRRGLNVELGLFKGIELDADALQNLLTGAVEMAIPERYGEAVKQDWVFRLHAEPESDWRRWQPALETP